MAADSASYLGRPPGMSGLITEPVPRQRLQQQSYNVQSLSLQDGQYRAVAMKDGKTVIVWMDAKSGRVEERKEP